MAGDIGVDGAGETGGFTVSGTDSTGDFAGGGEVIMGDSLCCAGPVTVGDGLADKPLIKLEI
jgi:hypothetical protein